MAVYMVVHMVVYVAVQTRSSDDLARLQNDHPNHPGDKRKPSCFQMFERILTKKTIRSAKVRHFVCLQFDSQNTPMSGAADMPHPLLVSIVIKPAMVAFDQTEWGWRPTVQKRYSAI